jgi:hypothetical protein
MDAEQVRLPSSFFCKHMEEGFPLLIRSFNPKSGIKGNNKIFALFECCVFYSLPTFSIAFGKTSVLVPE